MAKRADLQDWVLEALNAHDGEADVVSVCRYIWGKHEAELRASGDLFFTWQYDVRWAATKLRKAGKLAEASREERGVWRLA